MSIARLEIRIFKEAAEQGEVTGPGVTEPGEEARDHSGPTARMHLATGEASGGGHRATVPGGLERPDIPASLGEHLSDGLPFEVFVQVSEGSQGHVGIVLG